MNSQAQKILHQIRRTTRGRYRISGTTERPRLTVNISNNHITAQVIDDSQGKTLAYVTTMGQKIDGPFTAKADWVGKEIAKKAKKVKVKAVVFDRHGRKYHGRLKSLADGARQEGLVL